MARYSIQLSKETKETLDKLKHYGQTYEGVVRELLEKLGYVIKGDKK